MRLATEVRGLALRACSVVVPARPNILIRREVRMDVIGRILRKGGQPAAVAAAAAVVVTAVMAISVESAFGCTQSADCHGTVRWLSTPDYYGAIAALQVTRLEQSNTPTVNTGDFADQEMWVGTNGNAAGDYWVENGMARGWPQSAGAGIYWFWADKRPCCAYAEHDFLDIIRTSTTYTAKINYIGNNSWNVFRDGTQLVPGTSVSNPHVNGTGASLQKRSAGGASWSYGWAANPFYESPAFAHWTPATSQTSFQDYINPSTAVSVSARRRQLALRTAGPPDTLALIKEFANLNGEASPTEIRTIATTRAAAFAALGAGADDVPQTPTNLVLAHGAFIGLMAKVPQDVSAPRGRLLFLLIDSTSGMVTDWGITNADPVVPPSPSAIRR
jgi:hypothetical protein